MKLRNRAMRASAALLGGTVLLIPGTAFAAGAADINDGGVLSDDPATALVNEGIAITCPNVDGVAKMKNDANTAGFGFAIDNLNIVGLKLNAPEACTENQDVSAHGGSLGAGAAGDELQKMAGKMQSSDLDCVSDTLEASLLAGYGKTDGDEYPLSGKMTLKWEGVDPVTLKNYSTQVYVRTTTASSLLGDTAAFTGLVIKGAALGGVITEEIGFSPTAVTDDGDGYDDVAGGAAVLAFMTSNPPLTVPVAGSLEDRATQIDMNADGIRDVQYDDDNDGFTGLWEDDDANGRPDNYVQDACLSLLGVSLDADPDAEMMVPTGAAAPVGAAGDSINAISFTTDTATLSSDVIIAFED